MENLITLILICAGLSLVLNVLLKKLQVESVIGYILTGMAVGFAFDLEHSASLETVAEFGIVFLMFTIGLEFSPHKLRLMKKEVFLYGTLQMGITATVFFAAGHYLLALEPAVNLIVSLALALSSTAIVLNLLTKNRKVGNLYGRNAVGVLLFQDIAVIPVLLMVSIFASNHQSVPELLLDVVIDGAIVFALLFFGARFATPHLMEQVIGSRSNEIFVGALLLFVIGAAQLAHTLGFSYSLGAFIAGMVIAETHYKHQVEADLIPFRDLLLGVFFITVGMQVSPPFVLENLFLILAVMISLLVVKSIILFALIRVFHGTRTALKTALLLSQCGEFSFVIFETAQANDLFMDQEFGQILVMAIVFTMMLTPFLFRSLDRITDLLVREGDEDEEVSAEQPTSGHDHVKANQVVICGFGSLGKRVAQHLVREDIDYVGVEHEGHMYRAATDDYLPVIFGNASRSQFLRGIHIDQARAVVIAMSNEERIRQVAHTLQHVAPEVPVFVCSSNDKLIAELDLVGSTQSINTQDQKALALVQALQEREGRI
ncbi:cation:proton antiporter [Pontibacterium sp.]|uniref:cation:proton antiporter n=1 Tax=Pontibacterium sp. TaxID=2036026 RepID=UPI0035197154